MGSSDNLYFWFLWSVTLSICTWTFIEAIRRPQRLLEWPFMACAMWSYFYVYMAFDAKRYLGDYLPSTIPVLGQFVPLLCLVGIIMGWRSGLHSSLSKQGTSPHYPIGILWFTGVAITAVGAYPMYVIVNTTATGGIYDFENSTAYWYLFFYVGYPGLALAVWAISQRKVVYYSWLWLITISVLLVFIYPQIKNARRGPTFPAVLIFLVMPSLAKRSIPKRVVFIGGLLCVGLAMLYFVSARFWTYNEGTWKEAFQSLTLRSVVSERNKVETDNEYLNNCHLIWALYRNGKYQYGTGHLELLVHWIPHQFWRSKPTLGEGWYSHGELFDDVEAATGIRLLGGGAAAGGVADSFLQYGFLAPLFWYGLSWLMARVYLRARYGNDLRWQCSYIAFMCATHWLVSQGFAAAFVPWMCFLAVPLLVSLILRKNPPRARANMPKQPIGLKPEPEITVK